MSKVPTLHLGIFRLLFLYLDQFSCFFVGWFALMILHIFQVCLFACWFVCSSLWSIEVKYSEESEVFLFYSLFSDNL